MMASKIVPVTAGQIRGNRKYNNKFDEHLGIKIADDFISSSKMSIATATPPDTAKNIHGVVHGGWTAALLDTVAGGTVHSHQPGSLENNEYALTSSLTINYNLPVYAGNTYRCEGKITGRNGNNIETQATVIDDQGRSVATAVALVKARTAQS